MSDLPFAETLCMPPVTVDFTFVSKPSLLVKVARLVEVFQHLQLCCTELCSVATTVQLEITYPNFRYQNMSVN